MNDTLKTQLNHRSIRAYQDKPLNQETVQTLIDVAMRTASSNGMQQASIIRITDPKLKSAFFEITNQDYIQSVPECWVFVTDNHRNHVIMQEKGYDFDYTNTIYRFTEAFTDACLMAQNVVVAAESLGLGTVYFGSILNDCERVIELLKLPQLTYPVIALGIGIPNQEPQLKPRMDHKLRVFENEYHHFDNYLETFKKYDEQMQQYYDLRNANQRVDSFTNQVVTKNQFENEKCKKLLTLIRKQGYDV